MNAVNHRPAAESPRRARQVSSPSRSGGPRRPRSRTRHADGAPAVDDRASGGEEAGPERRRKLIFSSSVVKVSPSSSVECERDAERAVQRRRRGRRRGACPSGCVPLDVRIELEDALPASTCTRRMPIVFRDRRRGASPRTIACSPSRVSQQHDRPDDVAAPHCPRTRS